MSSAIIRAIRGGTYSNDDSKLVLKPVKLDLQRYSSVYTGPVKYLRLMHIAQVCPYLRGQALKLAHDYIKTSTYNLSAYEQIFVILLQAYNEKHLNEELMDTDTILDGEAMKIVKSGNNEAGLVYDEEWVRSMASRVNKTRDHLETELKTSKINGIVVHARKAYTEMGDFWLKCGDFLNALRCYTRSREYSQSPGDDMNSCLKITRMAILQAYWTQAGAYAKLAESCCEVDCTASKNTGNAEATEIFLKARRDGRDLFEYHQKNLPSEKTPDQLPIANQIAKAELHLIFGLLKLVAGDYRDSIEQFVQANIDPEECTFDNPSNFITHSDIARCVAVCALATLNRSALKTDILNHPSFRLVLESEVEARDLLLAFYSADYASVFTHLERLKSYLKLDIFAADHVEELYRMIRVKALHQYFVPFVRADLSIMAEAFGTSVTDLVGELADLIRTGTIKARIDYEKQLLCRTNVDDRNQTFKDTMRVIDQCHQRLQAAILRANIIRRGYAAGHQIGPLVW